MDLEDGVGAARDPNGLRGFHEGLEVASGHEIEGHVATGAVQAIGPQGLASAQAGDAADGAFGDHPVSFHAHVHEERRRHRLDDDGDALLAGLSLDPYPHVLELAGGVHQLHRPTNGFGVEGAPGHQGHEPRQPLGIVGLDPHLVHVLVRRRGRRPGHRAGAHGGDGEEQRSVHQ